VPFYPVDIDWNWILFLCVRNRVTSADYLNTFAFMDKLAENLRAKLA